jgi:maltooligosyltrehalose trehalohydrolase
VCGDLAADPSVDDPPDHGGPRPDWTRSPTPTERSFLKIGARYLGQHRCEFVVWAPRHQAVEVQLVTPTTRQIPLQLADDGYWCATATDVRPDALYRYVLDSGHARPDPASHAQPDGVHGPSQIIDHAAFAWEDGGWRGMSPAEMILYELHVGAFTPEGTCDAILPRLDALRELGITAVELMPVAPFPGARNWGYDGVYPFAVHRAYGGPAGLKRLVNACHARHLAVVLDVVYNHLGPEGNYMAEFGPYFTQKYTTPWGAAINFDDAWSDGVRNYFIENALHWFSHYHIDALRLDAIHGILDHSAKPLLQELAERIAAWSAAAGRKVSLIAESDRNDARVIRPASMGGDGLDAQWSDDFHHALHTLLTGETQGYYEDFGTIEQMATAFREGFVYSGQYSRYRKRRHGNSSADRPADQFIVYAQNHDQVGNRLNGERLSRLVSFEALKLSAGVVVLAPAIPLLFMGEEYGEESPFLYFVSHTDPGLIESVRRGRKEEFRAFRWSGEPPDPQAEETFLRSKINWEQRGSGRHRLLLELYRELFRLRKATAPLARPDRDRLDVRVMETSRALSVRQWTETVTVLSLFNFGDAEADVPEPDRSTTLEDGRTWEKLLDSAEARWNGPGSVLPARVRAHSFAVYRAVRHV